jgi:hypothetical protein
MKFLLGIKASQNISKGTITYKKKTEDDGYYMQYAAIGKGLFKPTLKFIELTSREKDAFT